MMEIDPTTKQAVRNSLKTILKEAADDPMYPQPLRERLTTIRTEAEKAGTELRRVGL